MKILAQRSPKALFLWLCALLAAAAFLLDALKKTTLFPYVFEETSFEGAEQAGRAHVLVIGDRLGIKLDEFLPSLNDKASEGLKERLRIYNWSQAGEGLHRSLAKIRSLNKLPPVVVYHGGSQEFYERRFHPDDIDTLRHNLSLLATSRLKALITRSQILAKLIYRSYQKPVSLNPKPKEDEEELDEMTKLRSFEHTYFLFEIEMDRLVSSVTSRGSNMLIITAPTDILEEYGQLCPKSTTASLDTRLDGLELMVKRGRSKLAVDGLRRLAQLSPTNSRIHYILGRAYLELGRRLDARESLERATAFDCEPRGGNIVFNTAMARLALRHSQPFIDFHGDIHTLLGQVAIFQDSYPHDLFYEALVNKSSDIIRSLLDI